MTKTTLYCALCLHVKTGVANKADTIIDGNASCYDHMGYLSGTRLSGAISFWREQNPEVETGGSRV